MILVISVITVVFVTDLGSTTTMEAQQEKKQQQQPPRLYINQPYHPTKRQYAIPEYFTQLKWM